MPKTFAQLGVPNDLSAALARRGITAPFDVQAAAIPDALAGRDVCGRAPTGSGKTLAFGLPLLALVGPSKPRRPRALVLVPTRELAAQIQRELAPLAKARGRQVVSIYGGVGYEPQRRALRRGVDVLVACPGRLADLVEQDAVRLDEVDVVVVDEADRMADMGFLPQVRRLLDRTPSGRQTLLFSATLDGDVAVLTREYQNAPVRHEVGATEPDVTAAEHRFLSTEPAARVARCARLVRTHGATVVFCRTRHAVDRIVKQLGHAGVDAAAIHGGRSQGQRDRALQAFKAGHVQALVATDVAARGIHVDGVACVVHFDPPEDAKTYVHRSGRTARAGARGVVVSLVSSAQTRDARRIGREVGVAVDLEHDDGGTAPDEAPTVARRHGPHGARHPRGDSAKRPGPARNRSGRRGPRRG